MVLWFYGFAFKQMEWAKKRTGLGQSLGARAYLFEMTMPARMAASSVVLICPMNFLVVLS